MTTKDNILSQADYQQAARTSNVKHELINDQA